ncbi:hypothetical protein [Litorihabitans aurantiacus]|uniref:Uncharacterized protein n=1 Tax=Litorihabitans aurantiacus TaxID=1930061 RepID=A0AA37XEY3_9MICO|nr:hypothetical protein [Litorihabitans aurantiacus]GMA32098.1 hypothetical protein GCM10025875_20900 [Litorihabitans aurantiacus]
MTTALPIDIGSALPAPADDAILAHSSAWRERADRAVAAEAQRLDGLAAVASSDVVVSGTPDALEVRVTCTLASEIVPLDVMRELEALPDRVAGAIGLPLAGHHLDLAIDQHDDVVAAA